MVISASDHTQWHSNSVGLCTRDRPVAEPLPVQHTTLTTDVHAQVEIRTCNPSSRRIRSLTARPPGICLHPSTVFKIGHGCTITHMYLAANVKGKWRCRSVPSTLTIRAEGPAGVMLSPRHCEATNVTLLSSSEIGMRGQHVYNRCAIITEMEQSITAVLLRTDKLSFPKRERQVSEFFYSKTNQTHQFLSLHRASWYP